MNKKLFFLLFLLIGNIAFVIYSNWLQNSSVFVVSGALVYLLYKFKTRDKLSISSKIDLEDNSNISDLTLNRVNKTLTDRCDSLGAMMIQLNNRIKSIECVLGKNATDEGKVEWQLPFLVDIWKSMHTVLTNSKQIQEQGELNQTLREINLRLRSLARRLDNLEKEYESIDELFEQ